MARKPLSPEALERQRENTRVRVAKHRDRKRKEQNLACALAEVTTGAGKGRALLKHSLAKHAVTVDRLVATKAQALEATKFRKIGNEIVEVPDHASRLRGAEQLDQDLQRIGVLPGDKRPPTVGHLHVHLTMYGDDGQPGEEPKVIEMGEVDVTNSVTQGLSASLVDAQVQEPERDNGEG